MVDSVLLFTHLASLLQKPVSKRTNIYKTENSRGGKKPVRILVTLSSQSLVLWGIIKFSSSVGLLSLKGVAENLGVIGLRVSWILFTQNGV